MLFCEKKIGKIERGKGGGKKGEKGGKEGGKGEKKGKKGGEERKKGGEETSFFCLTTNNHLGTSPTNPQHVVTKLQ